ncbi:CKLF-like MARVEL transmembrane domain-containing protein 8 isoform X3 [Bombus pyrosoma]|uniref:CKLF-like MARVEL transmembrane domain-containing protein 8 isoform X3 n=1 Tax=Bombus pyrosoma TaxID=396416 RepID=UPI001CB91EC4|nr:CKLF-like MARVEL transmembrane domain-containing protein 8 isoform X3 [Bombus pyrosoma]
MDQGFPAQHTTTTTVTTTSTTTLTSIRFDPSYIKTLPGMLKVAQVVLNLLGFICITVTSHSNFSRGAWFNTVAMGGFWFTGILLVFYLFHIVEKFSKIPWLKILPCRLLLRGGKILIPVETRTFYSIYEYVLFIIRFNYFNIVIIFPIVNLHFA